MANPEVQARSILRWSALDPGVQALLHSVCAERALPICQARVRIYDREAAATLADELGGYVEALRMVRIESAQLSAYEAAAWRADFEPWRQDLLARAGRLLDAAAAPWP